MSDWNKLLNTVRRKDRWKEAQGKSVPKKSRAKDTRTQLERDYDRILFSTPVRRMADKTQVFPLERNDSIRTRLTHSHEVANLARSIGTTLAFNNDLAKEADSDAKRNIPAILAAIGLAHDLGNPPFGHQGENAIQSWFEKNKGCVFNKEMTAAQKNDFLHFEGNAQTLRILTRLQIINDNFGLNLTFASLAGLMKYPTPSNKTDKNKGVAYKKFGFFQSEEKIVNEIWKETGLKEGHRHALTYIMEACDDIAYSVLDAEDAVKKGIVSFSDLIAFLKHFSNNDLIINAVIHQSCVDHDKHRQLGLSASELNDISMQMFRVYAINHMVNAITKAFLDNKTTLLSGNFDKELIEKSDAAELRNLLKEFDKSHIYSHRSILEVELTGYNTINKLMDIFWEALQNIEIDKDGKTSFTMPHAQYVFSRISENYRRVFLDENNKMPLSYKKLQLITDMISGMTDSYAISLLDELQKYDLR